MIAEKISVSSRASFARPSRESAVFFAAPASTSRKKRRLSFASFLQIFTRIRKSFLLRASSASIQFAATEPDARTNCRTSSVLLTVLGNRLTNARTDSANRKVRSSRSRGFPLVFHFEIWNLSFSWNLELGTWDLRSQPLRPLSALHPRDRRPRSARFHSLSATAFLARHWFLQDAQRAALTV